MRGDLIMSESVQRPATPDSGKFRIIFILMLWLTCSIQQASSQQDWSWGYNNHGQVGDGSLVERDSPVPVSSGSDWKQVACGFYHTVAIKNDGTLWAWGFNFYNQLGDGTITDRLSP